MRLHAPKHLQQAKRQGGFTLAEVALALVIGLGLAALALNAYVQSDESADARAHQEQIVQITSGVRSAFSGPVYTTLTNTVMSNKGKVPSAMRGATAADIVNNYGGTVTVAVASFGTATNNGFTVASTLVPRSACNTIVEGLKDAYSRIVINGSSVAKNLAPATGAAVPFTPATVTTGCNNDLNTVQFGNAG